MSSDDHKTRQDKRWSHFPTVSGRDSLSVPFSNMASMLEFRTRGFNPYAVKYSPYYDNRVAVASAANFGIVGNGRLFALGLTAAGIEVEKTYGARPPSSS